MIYVITLVNGGTTPLRDLSINDNLGVYQFNGVQYYPLNYTTESTRYFINGVLQPTPTVTVGPPLVIGNINVPTGENAILIYEASVTN